jgi:cytochrome bd-type quinol oxidase subunit 2
MTPAVEFLAEHLVLLPVVALLVLVVPTVLMVFVSVLLDEWTDNDAVDVAAGVAILVTTLGSIVAAGWLAWSVLSVADGWFADHRAWAMCGAAVILVVGVAVLMRREHGDAEAFWQLDEFADEFTDEEIAMMPKRHQAMVHALHSRSGGVQ